jgi:hypothetical protein
MRKITKFQLQKLCSLSFWRLVILLGDFHGQSHGSSTKVNFQLELVANSSNRSRCRWKSEACVLHVNLNNIENVCAAVRGDVLRRYSRASETLAKQPWQ